MLVAGLLLLPVSLILIWAYWALLPAAGGPRFATLDAVLISALLAASIAAMIWAMDKQWTGGAIIPHVMAAAGGYTVFAFGLLLLLAVRRVLHR